VTPRQSVPARAKRRLEGLSPVARLRLRHVAIPPLRGYFRYMPVAHGKDLVWRKLVSHLWWLEGIVDAPTVQGDVLRVDASDIVGRYIYYFGVWEPNLTAWLARTLRPGDGFVDVGANVGYFSAAASRLVGPEGWVVAIEALPDTHAVLRHNLARNGLANVRTESVAAWDSEDTLEFFTRAAGPSGTSTAYPEWAERWDLAPATKVPARRLADLLSDREIERARVVKIDAEGAEWRVLRGFADALPRCRPDIELAMEVAPALLRLDGASAAALVALLGEAGFRPYRLENDYSPAAYYGDRDVRPPTRIEEIPEDVEQMDVVFSRTDAAHL
jgi:FkbM family methyltransferase